MWGVWHRVDMSHRLAFLQQPSPLTEGALVRSSLDVSLIYYIQNGEKHVVSSDIFRLQGFSEQDVQTVPADALAFYPEGASVTALSYIVLPGEGAHLPDLVPLAARDLSLGTVNGRTVMRFTAIILNQGTTPMELLGDAQAIGDVYQNVFQRITHPDGTIRNKLVGNFYWHVPHNHYHYSDFVDYVFERSDLALENPTPNTPGTQQKTSFCLRDNRLLAPDLPHANPTKLFSICNNIRQGISVGWTDVYESTLPDQYIDVHDLPAGTYRLSFVVDPRQRFAELHKDNNISTVFVDLDPAHGMIRVRAAGAPLVTTENRFPDQMLIRGGGTSPVYVMHNNKRRWVRTIDVFNSYGYAWNAVAVLPLSVVQSVGRNNLIRLQGSSEMYALNDFGYRRLIRSPEILASYGLDTTDIASVNATEFAGYPETDLIRRSGDDTVYRINGSFKQNIGTFTALQAAGYDMQSVHVINGADFDSYQF